jgi:hypothetical protein
VEPQPINVERFSRREVFSWKNGDGSLHDFKISLSRATVRENWEDWGDWGQRRNVPLASAVSCDESHSLL